MVGSDYVDMRREDFDAEGIDMGLSRMRSHPRVRCAVWIRTQAPKR